MKNNRSTSTETVLRSFEWERTMKYICRERVSGRTIGKEKFGDVISKESKCHILPGLDYTNIAGKGCFHIVPQGICRAGDYVFITAYCYKKEHPSVIYVLQAPQMEYVCTLLTPEMAHLGGIAYDEREYLWVCIGDSGQQKIHGYNMTKLSDSIKKAKENPKKTASIFWEAVCDVDTTPSFCTFYDGMLWVGTFSRESEEKAIGYVVDGAILKRGASVKVPKNAQGMAFYTRERGVVRCMFSTSWGRKKDSKICVYTVDAYESRKERGRVLSTACMKTISMPSMMEGICNSGLSVYGIFESAARKYRNGDGKGKSTNPCDRICEFAIRYLFEKTDISSPVGGIY